MKGPDFQAAALVLAVIPTGLAILLILARGLRLVFAAPERRAVIRKARRIRRAWRRTAIRVGLAHTEQIKAHAPLGAPGSGRRTLSPAIRVKQEAWGVRIDAHTLGRLGLEQFQAATDHLANAWKVPLVRVEQYRPGVIRIRALLRDPLTAKTKYSPENTVTCDPATWSPGVDADGREVTIRSSGVSGVVVAGLAGYGKTSLLNARLCQLAASSAVQFVLIDGKGGPDRDGLFARAWLSAKDDPQLVRDHLMRVHELMTARQAAIRGVLGVKNIWHLGPSEAWPLVVVVVDEAHTFFNETKGTDAESKRRDSLARETTRLVEELVRKGRNVGIQVILATQKATGDAIPTRIRDNCQVAISFAQRTSEAATAALGSDIGERPDAHPRRLQDAAYIGVATMVAEGPARLHSGPHPLRRRRGRRSHRDGYRAPGARPTRPADRAHRHRGLNHIPYRSARPFPRQVPTRPMPDTRKKTTEMTSHLHVCLRLDADTAIETDAASKLGPHLRIGDGQEAVDLWLPFDAAKAHRLCRRLTDALTTLSLDLAEHGTAASAPR